jgi:hypothetical protein
MSTTGKTTTTTISLRDREREQENTGRISSQVTACLLSNDKKEHWLTVQDVYIIPEVRLRMTIFYLYDYQKKMNVFFLWLHLFTNIKQEKKDFFIFNLMRWFIKHVLIYMILFLVVLLIVSSYCYLHRLTPIDTYASIIRKRKNVYRYILLFFRRVVYLGGFHK